MQAWRNALDPEADAFSICAIGMPEAPRWRYMSRDMPIAVVAVPVYAVSTSVQRSPASLSA